MTVTPGNVTERLAAARPGDTVKLGAGEYRDLEIVGRRYSPSLVIDATDAKVFEARIVKSQGVVIRGGSFFLSPGAQKQKGAKAVFGAGIRMNDVEDVRIVGAKFIGPSAISGPQRLKFGEGFGVRIVGGNNIEVADSQFDGFASGMALTKLDGFHLTGNSFAGMRSDGLSVSLSRNGVIEKNECRSTRVRSDEHPDCIQMWSRPEAPPTSDIVIRKNRIKGPTQGIGLHNHVRNGVDDGGFDRITIEDNDIQVSRANAISLQNGRASIVRNNKVSTEPGARFRASIRTSGDSVKLCGNSVAEAAGKPSSQDPAC